MIRAYSARQAFHRLYLKRNLSSSSQSEFLLIDPTKPIGNILTVPLSRPKPASQVLVNKNPKKKIRLPTTPPMSDPILTMSYAKRLFPHEFTSIIEETKEPEELLEVYHIATKKEGYNPRKRITKFEPRHSIDILTHLHRVNQPHINPRWKLMYEHTLIQLYRQTQDFLLFYTPRDMSQLIYVLGRGIVKNEEERNLLDQCLAVYLQDQQFPLSSLNDFARVLWTLSDLRRTHHPLFKRILSSLPQKLEEVEKRPKTIKAMAKLSEALSFSNSRKASYWTPMIEYMMDDTTLDNAEMLEVSQFLLALARCNPKADWSEAFSKLADWSYDQALGEQEEETKEGQDNEDEEDEEEDEEDGDDDASWNDPKRENRRFCRSIVNITDALTFPQRKCRSFKKHRWFTDDKANVLQRIGDQKNLEELEHEFRKLAD